MLQDGSWMFCQNDLNITAKYEKDIVKHHEILHQAKYLNHEIVHQAKYLNHESVHQAKYLNGFSHFGGLNVISCGGIERIP